MYLASGWWQAQPRTDRGDTTTSQVIHGINHFRISHPHDIRLDLDLDHPYEPIRIFLDILRSYAEHYIDIESRMNNSITIRSSSRSRTSLEQVRINSILLDKSRPHSRYPLHVTQSYANHIRAIRTATIHSRPSRTNPIKFEPSSNYIPTHRQPHRHHRTFVPSPSIGWNVYQDKNNEVFRLSEGHEKLFRYFRLLKGNMRLPSGDIIGYFIHRVIWSFTRRI